MVEDKTPGGWGVFAALLLLMNGTFTAIQGIVALAAPERLFAGEHTLVVLDYDRWGWVLLIWGVLLAVAGGALLAGATWARVFGVVVAFVNAVGQLTWIGTQPWLSLLLIALNIGVIWGLTAGWPEHRRHAAPTPPAPHTP
ncbi:hypothetical protein G4H71_08345 [Rhodococcus triatomae]|uniref:DUF7144 domain-containing protein n=1 Tax=Rhodococcus triatomae TaxID=300028 RepID=A0A1G8IF66_9NOCA|nr:hypothetical protein [Rhodococcus triatomae]QNG21043.1 hypothetical protein G4H72_22040 [Rhodococcus triatomae]QNG23042.1 hypothetical protein G4H71_08345 [Rhodococcus triatomae]SDI17669.1 hypothetical protein SAMN05444695_105264 [Rhodococcus triatomae]